MRWLARVPLSGALEGARARGRGKKVVHARAGRRVCRVWQRGLDMMVTRLRVGPQTREPHAWNRQLLMMRRLPGLFPCLREIDFDQAR